MNATDERQRWGAGQRGHPARTNEDLGIARPIRSGTDGRWRGRPLRASHVESASCSGFRQLRTSANGLMRIVAKPRLLAELTISKGADGREHYLAVAKRSYSVHRDRVVVSRNQRELVYADRFDDDPTRCGMSAASDFALVKPRADVVVVGHACAPSGSRVREVDVRFRFGSRIDKRVHVTGDRVWRRGLLLRPVRSSPIEFERIPISYERAFGGAQTLHRRPSRHRFVLENPVGVGFMRGATSRAIGLALPNVEDPAQRLIRPWQRRPVAGLSFIAPSWPPRSDFAGTYDESWLAERFPLLPLDFDPRFNQVAPSDQIVDRLQAGDRVRIDGMRPDGPFVFELPDLSLPVTFLFKSGADVRLEATPDTLVIYPDDASFAVTWRASLPVREKLYDLRLIAVGERSTRWLALQRSPRPHYRSLDAFIRERSL